MSNPNPYRAALERIANSCEEFHGNPDCADPVDLCEAMAQDARAALTQPEPAPASCAHTGGTWYVQQVGSPGYYAVRVLEADRGVPMTGEEGRANARLMAAAPRLLAALDALQANPNDPRAHRGALDALKVARGQS